MIFLLDTNACISCLNRRPTGVWRRLCRTKDRDIAICSVVKAELFAGARRSSDPRRALAGQRQFLGRFRSLPFDDRAAEVTGHIHAKLAALGTPIGPLDLLIAAIALANGLTLVTHNTREFGRVDGLTVDDWENTTP